MSTRPPSRHSARQGALALALTAALTIPLLPSCAHGPAASPTAPGSDAPRETSTPTTPSTQSHPWLAPGSAVRPPEPVPLRSAYLDDSGVVRWSDTDEEVALFGANYALPTAGDYRAAGHVTQDRKALIDQDMAHFARMGWNGLRVAFWGDWQSADLEGNLIENDHLDLMDYLIAKARERGIYILFNPIHTYDAGWPDAMGDSFPGFAAHTPKNRLGTDSAAIAAQVNYVRQILEHVNPYTGVRLADEPSILFVEMINEPTHHPEDVEGSVRYINALVDAVRAAGSDAITFHNVSQDFRIAEAIRRSRVQGASYGWYPTGLNVGHELLGNHLRSVDDYPPMRQPLLDGMPKAVYEFDTADQRTGYMYLAMARAYRAGGAQFAAMFAYDMLATASRNLGWQTHYLNLVYTPRKAMSAILAAEAMRRLPSLEDYGPYPENRTFGPFRVSHEENLGELAAPDAFIHAGSTTTVPPSPATLERVAGYGSSPVVRYEGEGVYFLDRVRDGVWRLEVYPDAVPVEDPFERPNPDKVVTRALHRSWPMTIDLPDLGAGFHVQPIVAGNTAPSRAEGGRFTVRPGVYVLGAAGPVDPGTLPASIGPDGAIGFHEWVAPAADDISARVLSDAPAQHVAGRPLELEARVVTDTPPDAVTLWIGRAIGGGLRAVPMSRAGSYRYIATLPADALSPGEWRYVVSVDEGDRATTFPARVPRTPASWSYGGDEAWTFTVVEPRTPLRLLDPGRDGGALTFSRIGDGWRQGIFRILPSDATGQPVLHLELPVNVDGITPEDYRTSLFVRDRVRARGDAIRAATGVRLHLRGLAPGQRLHLTLVERDGTGWSVAVETGTEWRQVAVPLDRFRPTRSANIPMGFPGHWNYWLESPAGRGDPGDALRIADVERLQLSLRSADAGRVAPGEYGVEVESITLVFE